MLKTRKLNRKAFSLIELMLVVAIIGILATVAVPNFYKFQAKSRQAEVRGHLGGIYMGENAFTAEWLQYYGDLRDIGFSPTGTMKYVVGFAGTNAAPVAPFTGSSAGCAAGAAFNTGIACAAPQANTAAAPAFAAATAAGPCAAGANPTAASFTISAIGAIGGGANDIWTLTENQAICNNVSGF